MPWLHVMKVTLLLSLSIDCIYPIIMTTYLILSVGKTLRLLYMSDEKKKTVKFGL